MDIGFETIGNATLICHDRSPILVTDPWIVGGAYFGSWTLSHQIPGEQMAAIKSCQYVWLSHGHPDHLSGASLELLRDKKLLLPDHAGRRIADGLEKEGFDITILKDREWTPLSPRIRVVCIADYNQDAILLLDIDGTLVINLNDANDRGWRRFVKAAAAGYGETFLLKLFGYADADMINFFDEDGKRIEPPDHGAPLGDAIGHTAEVFGARYVIPFSSLHSYQRADSAWANQYTTPLEAYSGPPAPHQCEILPAFIRYDCREKKFVEINPPRTPDSIIDPKEFGDDWSEPLDRNDVQRLDAYFRSIAHMPETLDYLNFRVGGKDNRIEFVKRDLKRGVTFEVPRHSLMQAVEWEIFDDLLIGNFMKTTLEGEWPLTGLYPDFTPYVAKYADNGRAKSKRELQAYFRNYRGRAPLDYSRHRIQYHLFTQLRPRFNSNTRLYRFARSSWLSVQRWV